MRSNHKVISTMDRKKIQEAVDQEVQALLQMYQAGYVDGFNKRCNGHFKFKQLRKVCKKDFELRFMKDIKVIRHTE